MKIMTFSEPDPSHHAITERRNKPAHTHTHTRDVQEWIISSRLRCFNFIFFHISPSYLSSFRFSWLQILFSHFHDPAGWIDELNSTVWSCRKENEVDIDDDERESFRQVWRAMKGKLELSHIVLAHFKSTHIKMCPMNYGLERKSLPHIAAHMNLLILDPHMRGVEGGTANIGDITPYPSCHRRRLFMSSKFIFHFHELQTIASTHSHALLSSLSRRLARFFMADFTVAICLPLQNIMLWNVNI